MRVEIEMSVWACSNGHVYAVPSNASTDCPFCLKASVDALREEKVTLLRSIAGYKGRMKEEKL